MTNNENKILKSKDSAKYMRKVLNKIQIMLREKGQNDVWEEFKRVSKEDGKFLYASVLEALSLYLIAKENKNNKV